MVTTRRAGEPGENLTGNTPRGCSGHSTTRRPLRGSAESEWVAEPYTRRDRASFVEGEVDSCSEDCGRILWEQPSAPVSRRVLTSGLGTGFHGVNCGACVTAGPG